MQRKLKIAAILLLSGLIVSAVYATIILTLPVNNIGSIKSAPGMQLELEDGTIITEINWNELEPSSTITTFDLFGQDLRLHNIGNKEWWQGWNKNGLPSGMTLTCEYWNSYEEWMPFPENGWNIGNIMNAKPGGYAAKFRFTLTTTPISPAGAFSFTINFLAANSITG